MHKPSRITLVALLGLLLAACGGDDPAGEAPDGSAAGPSPASTAAEPTSEATTTTTVTGPPQGFAASCASAFPEDEPLPFDFACIDEPRPSVVLIGQFEAHGYAATSTGELIIEVRGPDGTAFASQPVEFSSERPGLLAPWQATMAVPTEAPPGPAIVAVYFQAADGSRLGESTSEVFVEPEFN